MSRNKPAVPFVMPLSIADLIEEIADSRLRILLLGPPGVGKTALAMEIHRRSRPRGPFVVFDCGAQPPNLFEAELFGHEKGAFTGAERTRKGRVAEAEGGTLFFDEIGELAREEQGRLLGFLNELKYRSIGSDLPQRADVRIICATHRPVELLRPELYGRLAEVPIQVPDLNERPGEIVPIAETRLEYWSDQEEVPTPVLGLEAQVALIARTWIQNARELDTLMHRAVVRAKRERVRWIEARHLDLPSVVLEGSWDARMRAFEELVAKDALRAADGNVTDAVRSLGMSRSRWYERARRRQVLVARVRRRLPR